jgi:periplasmic protein CpxP/Spy
MKKRNVVIALIVAAVMIAAVPIIHAAPGGFRHRGPGGHGGPGGFAAGMMFSHLQHLQEELDLSEAQVNQIRGIFSTLHEQNAPLREQMKGGFHTVAAALIANPNDLSAAQALLDQQSAAERTLKANMLAATSKALNVLTAEQRTELAQIVEERHDRREERRNRR